MVASRAVWRLPSASVGYQEGALLIVPIVIVGVLATGEHPLRTLGLGLLVFGLAAAGAALSGLAYSFVGRHLRPTRVIGPYLAGWFSTWPYVLVVLIIIRLHEGTPLAASLKNAEWFTLGLGILFVGAIVGFAFFQGE